MNNIIILTKESKEGQKLHQALCAFDDMFKDIPVYTKEDLLYSPQLSQQCEVIFSSWYMPVFTKEEVASFFPSLQAIFYAAGTTKYFAEPFWVNNVRIFSASQANGLPVAEFVAAQIILANKGYYQASKRYKWPMWPKRFAKAREFSCCHAGNYNAKIGIIGCGSVGTNVVKLLQSYKLSIYVYDPFVADQKIKDLGAEKIELKDLFSICDVISNHLPDLPETRGILNYGLFSIMKPTATFINTGRGRQVVESDLARVLRKNRKMCALLDVTTHEPLFPWSPLYRCSNIFFTPHIAGSLSNEYDRLAEYMWRAYEDVKLGQPNSCEIIPDQMSFKA